MNKLTQERQTVQAMIRIYCKDRHGGDPLCAECAGLSTYADERLEKCPYGEGKPTCQNCPIHCYQQEKREQIRQVMRHAGPRMIWHHPVLAIRHLIHNRKAPGAPMSRRSTTK